MHSLLLLAAASIILSWTTELVECDGFPKARLSKRQTGDVTEDEAVPQYVEILRGRDGRDGLPGRDGFKGEKGCRGMTGLPGRDGGQPGEKGDPGPPGQKGATGSDGLNGITGPPGEIGDTGLQGDKGMKGDTGSVGPIGPQGPTGPVLGGVTYVRWGQTVCPDIPGTELVYTGRAAGSFWTNSGGGANYQCLPMDPETFCYGNGTSESAYIYGAEYETGVYVENLPTCTASLHDVCVPCTVCYVSTRVAILTIPGKYNCPDMWTREYYGYLMTSAHDHHRATFECVDSNPQSCDGSDNVESNNLDGALFFHVEPRCGSLPCPPYEEEKEITCAVCTR